MEASAAVTALTTAMTTVASDAVSSIIGMVGVAAPVLGTMFVVSAGIKAFKKIGGR